MGIYSGDRKELPADFEKRYKSETLKEKIADEGMWALIPSVKGDMNSREGISRIKENDLLFSFIDEYFSDLPFAFEPNMQDRRFVFLPDDVHHQGIGICVSENLPGLLEVGHFWYPAEFTEKKISFGPGQVYVPMFQSKPQGLVKMIRDVYMRPSESERYCTFPFTPEQIVTLKGDFLDRMPQTTRQIKNALKQAAPPVRRNAEGLIMFMHRIMN